MIDEADRDGDGEVNEAGGRIASRKRLRLVDGTGDQPLE